MGSRSVSINSPRLCKYAKSRVHELCERGGGSPGLPVPNNPYSVCARKPTLNPDPKLSELRSCEKSRWTSLAPRP